MAFTVNHLGDAYSSYNNSLSTAGFLPTANTLLVASVRKRSNFSVSSVTGHGTWTLIDSVAHGSGEILTYYTVTSASPTSSPVSISFSGTDLCELSVEEIVGADNLNPIVQSNFVTSYAGSAPTDITAPLAAFETATNLTFLTGVRAEPTAETGFTTAYSGTRLSTFYKEGEDTTPTYETTREFFTCIAGALEVRESAGGGGNTGPSIDNIDGDNEVRAGQQSVVITGTDIENATSVTLGGEAVTIV